MVSLSPDPLPLITPLPGTLLNFIDKIVQVPLQLPLADASSLRHFCLQRVDQALGSARLQLDEQQVQAFVRNFDEGLEIRLETPRLAKRYANILTFSLPILKGEVHPVDLMLIEGIRVFYPELYECVRRNPDAFLGPGLGISSTITQTKVEQYKEVVDRGLKSLTNDERRAAKDLLTTLFPRLETIYGGASFPPEWDTTWANEKRVASQQYFNRYFTYSVPEGDIPDQQLDTFVTQADEQPVEVVVASLRSLVNSRNAERFASKLRRRAKGLPPPVSSDLARAISVRRQNKWDKRGAFKACNLDANRLRQFSDLPTSVRLDSFASPPVSSPVWRLAVRGTYPPA